MLISGIPYMWYLDFGVIGWHVSDKDGGICGYRMESGGAKKRKRPLSSDSESEADGEVDGSRREHNSQGSAGLGTCSVMKMTIDVDTGICRGEGIGTEKRAMLPEMMMLMPTTTMGPRPARQNGVVPEPTFTTRQKEALVLFLRGVSTTDVLSTRSD
jgi:hypothetical protein